MQQREAVESAVGITVGTCTAVYSWLCDAASTAEQVGIICGALLTVILLGREVYKLIKPFFKKKTNIE